MHVQRNHTYKHKYGHTTNLIYTGGKKTNTHTNAHPHTYKHVHKHAREPANTQTHSHVHIGMWADNMVVVKQKIL